MRRQPSAPVNFHGQTVELAVEGDHGVVALAADEETPLRVRDDVDRARQIVGVTVQAIYAVRVAAENRQAVAGRVTDDQIVVFV